MSDDSSGTKPSIVLVDDSYELRSLVRQRLEASGFEVVGEGQDGDQAIVLAHQHHPTLLLLDTSMPHVDGLEALPMILAVAPSTRVVVFTGFEDPELVERALELGASDFIEKSIRLEELPQLLRQVLAAPADRREARGDTEAAEERLATSAEPDLAEHLRPYRELFDRAEIGMATLTCSGSVVHANQVLAGLMACDPLDLVGVDYGRLTVGKGDELDRSLEEICSLGADLASFEHSLPTAPGEPASRVVRVTLSPIRDSRRQPLYVFAQVQDVTTSRRMEETLHQSQELFRRIVTAVSEYAIFMLDVDGKVISWNAGAERIKGYTADEIIGRDFRVFYLPEEQTSGHPEQNLQAALRTGSFAEEGWRVRKDGSRFWASVVISPVYDEDGRHLGFAKVTRDRTEQRRLEEERRTLLDQRINLLGLTVHELRAPAAVIDGAAGALRSSWSELGVDDRVELLANIHGGAERLRRLAADLANESVLEGEVLPMRLEDVSLVDALRAARARIRAAAGAVAIELDLPDETTIRADQERLGQALDNLLDNAIRHGVPPVSLSCTVGDDVRIRVCDSGPGVPAGLVPRLFDRFAVGGGGSGTGLGLYIVREIARGHGGDATYHPPKGTRPATFELRLPRRG